MTERSIFVCLLLSATLPLAACSDDSGPASPPAGGVASGSAAPC